MCDCSESEIWNANIQRLARKIAAEIRIISESNGHCAEGRAIFSAAVSRALQTAMAETGDAVVVTAPPGERIH